VKALALAVALLAFTCSRGERSRCERICALEAECAETLELDVDRAECVEQCRELEKQSPTSARVDDHVACVERAKSCAAVVDCP
jgi:hypothetical protein